MDDLLPPSLMYRRLDRTYVRCPHCDHEHLLPPDEPYHLSPEFVESTPCARCDRRIYLRPVSLAVWAERERDDAERRKG